ncbi:MAG: hypothetical protein Q3961_04090 [Bifidobacteriaceae bacterium]|nr:hypothetical protein [Bifidobacteriaceae bacterium]
MPVGSGADEPSHIARVEQLSNGVIFPQRLEKQARFMIRSQLSKNNIYTAVKSITR